MVVAHRRARRGGLRGDPRRRRAALGADVERSLRRLSNRHDVVSFAQDTPLDGSYRATLRGPRDAKYDLILRAADRSVIDRTRGDGARDVLKAQICGVRSVSLEVVRKDGDGRFRVGVHSSSASERPPPRGEGRCDTAVPAERGMTRATE